MVIEVALNHVDGEPVDTRGHRGVGGEHGAGPHDHQRGVEVQSRFGDQLADPLGSEEPGVALVHVEYLGRGQPFDRGERADGPHPANAGQNLLPDAMFLVAAVQAVGDGAQVVLVFRDIGIQQEQRNATHLGDPDPGPQMCGIGQAQLDQHRVTVGTSEQPQRQPLRIQGRVGLVLPTVGGQRLPEVPGAVVQADRDQRHPQIGRGLQVVTRQDPEAARIVGQHLGNAELHREVRNGSRHCYARVLLLLIPPRTGQVIVQLARKPVEPVEEPLVQCQLVEPCRVHRTQQCHRVTALRPKVQIDGPEQVLRGRVPRPPQVGRQLFQRGEALG